MEDDFLESAYEERYEGEDYNLWEEQQVFLDNEFDIDPEEDEELPPDDEEKDYLAGSHGNGYDRPEPQF